MNAVILAGGFGNRLKPLTDEKPKPMLAVANKPMLDYTISHLASFGIKDYVFTLAYKPEQIVDWATGYIGATCRFSVEEIPLGTLGGVKAVEDYLDDTFFVVSGDAIENIDFAALLDAHQNSGALVTMAATEVSDPSQFGVVKTNEWGIVTGFIEKPPRGTVENALVNCGVYCIDKRALELVPKDTKYDFSLDLFPQLVENGKLAAYIHEGYWRDTGTLESLFVTNFELAQGSFFPPAPHQERASTSSEYSYRSGNLIGSGVSIDGFATNSILSEGCIVEHGAQIDSCIVLDGAVVTGNHKNTIIHKDGTIELDKLNLLQHIEDVAASDLWSDSRGGH